MDLDALGSELRAGIGARKVTEDVLSAAIVERLAATLDTVVAPTKGEPLPPGWHTVFCIAASPRSALDDDGLPLRYELVPPVPMPRRVFGGARMSFHAPLIVGEAVRCESELADIVVRAGKSADMVIATLRHRFSGGAGLAVVEEQDIIYLNPHDTAPLSTQAPIRRPVFDATWRREIVPDEIALFRFSALTFNSHRIHYDRPYATEIEKQPGLIVQGKLLALHLLDLVRREQPASTPRSFGYRGLQPLYANQTCVLAGRMSKARQSEQSEESIELAAIGPNGAIAQSATLII